MSSGFVIFAVYQTFFVVVLIKIVCPFGRIILIAVIYGNAVVFTGTYSPTAIPLPLTMNFSKAGYNFAVAVTIITNHQKKKIATFERFMCVSTITPKTIFAEIFIFVLLPTISGNYA